MHKIVVTDLEENPKRSAEFRKSSVEAAHIACVKEALKAIADANQKFDANARTLAIETYLFHRERALIHITAAVLRQRCEDLYMRCIVNCLKGAAYAIVDGNADLREKMVDWYEDDRLRMIDAGFKPFRVDALTNTRVWRGIR